MTIPKFLAAASLLAITIGCASEDDGSNNGSGGAGGVLGAGGSGGGAPLVCNTDFAQIGADPIPVSLRNDLMPIFNQSCDQTQCHDKDKPKALLYLSPGCARNLDTGACDEIALTEADVQEVYANMVGVASTTAPAVLRIAPQDPAQSFMVHKIADTHEAQGYACTPQDTMVTGCGDSMPPQGATLCTQNNGGQERFNMIVRWILQGAQNN
jgi:hypothetical protein